MSTILQELEATISGLKTDTTRSNVGTVREIGDGVAKIEGLSDVMLNEMIEFPGGLYGIALNLEETEVGAIIVGDYTEIKEGTEVRTTGKIAFRSRWERVARPGGQRFGPTDRRQRSGQIRGDLSGRKDCSRHYQAKERLGAGPDRYSAG